MRKWIDLFESDGFGDLVAAFKRHEMTDVKVARDRWLVHFTNASTAVQISQQGFRQGSPIDASLHLTWGSDYNEPGINFAYDANDEASIMTLAETTIQMGADGLVVFRADGVSMHHYDGWYQTAFWGEMAKRPMFALRTTVGEDDEGYNSGLEPHEREWKVVARDGQALDGPVGDLFDLLTWIETNA